MSVVFRRRERSIMRVTVETAVGVFEVEGDYEDLKTDFFPYLRQAGVFDREEKKWVLRRKVTGEAAEVLKLYGIPVEKHNRAIVEKLREEVRGTNKIYPLERLSYSDFKFILQFADWNREEGCFCVDKARLRAVLRRTDVEEKLSKIPVVYDPEILRFPKVSIVVGEEWVDVLGEREKIEELSAKFTVNYYIQELKEDEEGQITVLYTKTLLPLLRFRGVSLRGSLGLFAPLRATLGSEAEVVSKPEFSSIKVLKKDFELRDYQQEAYEKWSERKFGTIVIPTGGGKTYVALQAIADLKAPTLICVTTIELARQWRKILSEKLGIEAGLLGGGTKDIREVTVAIYNSAVKYLDKIKKKFAFHVYDEGHHVAAETFRQIAIRAYSEYRLCLSATPERYDNNHELIYALAGEPVYRISYTELVKRNYVAPIVYRKISGFLSAREESTYEAIDEFSEFDKYGKLRGFSQKKKIAFMAKWKYKKLEELLGRHKSSKILVFTEFLDQAYEAYRVAKNTLGETRVALITGQTAKGRRRDFFEAFKRGEVTCIVTTRVLDEGIDVPDADVAIIMSNSGQSRQMIQRIGRVIRPKEGKIAYVYDLVTANSVEEALWKIRYREASMVFSFTSPLFLY